MVGLEVYFFIVARMSTQTLKYEERRVTDIPPANKKKSWINKLFRRFT